MMLADISTTLVNCTEEGLRALVKSFIQAQDSSSSDIQKNVHKNYLEFIMISHEMSMVENDVGSLTSLLSDLKIIMDGYMVADVAKSGGETERRADGASGVDALVTRNAAAIILPN